MSAAETIREWLEEGSALPDESDLFFNMWVLLNAYYNEVYNEEHEWERVLHFGRDFNTIFSNLGRTILSVFVVPACIGEGELAEKPNPYVKKASEVLKSKLGVIYNCEECRRDKKLNCQDIRPGDYNFQDFEALMRILYQIRCNLFHGAKLDQNEHQNLRNQNLVTQGNIVLRTILEEVAKSAKK